MSGTVGSKLPNADWFSVGRSRSIFKGGAEVGGAATKSLTRGDTVSLPDRVSSGGV